jgi:hypothetical protein
MIPSLPALLCVTLLLPFVAIPAAKAQEFSATIVSTSPEGDQTNAGRGHVRVAYGKVRLELPDFPDGYFLIDPAANIADFVRPAQRVFMEARQSSRLAQILIPVDPDAPCRQWQAVAEITKLSGSQEAWHCTASGKERVDDRDTVRYLAVAPDGHPYDIWIDPMVKFPVKIRAEIHAVITVTDIKEGPQPAAAFEIPAGFSKFDPQGLIDRIKQSDVWVEKPPPQ